MGCPQRRLVASRARWHARYRQWLSGHSAAACEWRLRFRHRSSALAGLHGTACANEGSRPDRLFNCVPHALREDRKYRTLKHQGGSQDVPRTPAVLFVCLGNICRSPLAEAAFRTEVVRIGLDVEDSAGTGDWHLGKPPDRAQAVAKRYGIDISLHSARQGTRHDFQRFRPLVALELQSLAMLEAMRPADGAAGLLLDYVEGRKGEAVESLLRRGGRIRGPGPT